MNTDFAGLGLRPELLRSIAALGYVTPTAIQSETIPHLMRGADVVGQAATGTGKTAAFALPIVDRLDAGRPDVPVALVLVPTRELALQVTEAFTGYGAEQRVRALAVYGGSPIHHQIKALRSGVHVVVGTPGRTIDLLKRRVLDLSEIATVVLDEADEMLDMGFAEDIETVLEATPPVRQTVLFSATMPARIKAIAARHQTDPVHVKVARDDNGGGAPLIRETVYSVHRRSKAAALGRILDMEGPESALVFCRTRVDVDTLTATMNGRGYRAEALHGGMDQQQRDRVMARLRDGTADLLVATDVAARGLDVDTLTHVVNFDVPAQPESYVHRIGRVGRAGRQGVAITLAEPGSNRKLRTIERVVGRTLAVADVPSVEDLQARRLQQTLTAVKEKLGDNVDGYEAIVDQLVELADVRDIALAAIGLVHEARNPATDAEFIPPVADRGPGKRSVKHSKGGGQSNANGKRPKGAAGKARNGRHEKGDDRRGGERSRSADKGAHRDLDDTAFVYIGVGRRGRVRPGDLVGAIANETSLSGRDIGPIRISEHYSVVGVPPSALHEVIGAVNGSSIRGKRAKARPYT